MFDYKKPCSVEFSYINDDGREETETITNLIFNEYGKESSDGNIIVRESMSGESTIYYES